MRWGLIGTGLIADWFAADMAVTDSGKVVAVGSRAQESADRFADKFGIPNRHASYEALVSDPEVDVVYVATPHPMHYANTLLALDAAKPVLVEKSFTMNADEARQLVESARSKGLFLMEAMWTRFLPHIAEVNSLLAGGVLGDLVTVTADHGQWFTKDPAFRLFAPELGGGALLDLGVYPATFAFLFLGPPDTVHTVGTLSPTGSDETVAMQWMYGDHPGAQLWTSALIHAPNEAAILGTKGWISFLPEAYRPTGLILHTDAGEVHSPDPLAGNGHGYQPEIEEVERCLRAGLMESPLIPHADTIAILEILDGARAAVGVVYPGER